MRDAQASYRPRAASRAAIAIVALAAACLARAAHGQIITEFPVTTAASSLFGIAAGPDAALWFAESNANNIGRITTAGAVTEYPITTAASVPGGVALGPDGNIWFTEFSANKIGRITAAGVVTEFPIATAGSQPYSIVTGPDGNLWFSERTGNNVGRITTAGVITEFPVPTAASKPQSIAAGPDGNLWFAEGTGNQIGRVTTAGVVTEFPVITAASGPRGITAGPGGNLWFTEFDGNKIGRITPAGVVTEFPAPTAASQPDGIAAGADGNLWFTEIAGNQIGRITPAGVAVEFPIPTSGSVPVTIVAGPDGSLWFTEQVGNQIGRITTGPVTPQQMAVDAHAVTGTISNTNGVLEPGETVQVAPVWLNTRTITLFFGGVASGLTGPAGPTYTIDDQFAGYDAVPAGATSDCTTAPGGCYLMTVAGTRPVQHWDASFTETVSPSATVALAVKSWPLHIGGSFSDVPASNTFYGFIENLFHNGITGGCAGGGYCPTSSVTRAQMAVFLMKAKLGTHSAPPPATGTVFGDVPASNPFAAFIEQLAGFGVTGGCGSGNYCPGNPVTRAQMAVFLLKAKHGSAYTPPPCSGLFVDVPCPSAFAAWIEQLSAENITGGCGGGNYCPANPNTRGQMAVFLVKTFGLKLYGP